MRMTRGGLTADVAHHLDALEVLWPQAWGHPVPQPGISCGHQKMRGFRRTRKQLAGYGGMIDPPLSTETVKNG